MLMRLNLLCSLLEITILPPPGGPMEANRCMPCHELNNKTICQYRDEEFANKKISLHAKRDIQAHLYKDTGQKLTHTAVTFDFDRREE